MKFRFAGLSGFRSAKVQQLNESLTPTLFLSNGEVFLGCRVETAVFADFGPDERDGDDNENGPDSA